MDEVFDDREGLDVRRRKRGKSSSLGMPEAPQVNIPETQASKLGDAGKASPLSSTSIGMFSDSFRSCDMCNLGASFAFNFHFSFMHHAGTR